jgi:nucleotide-binding universal stress UspA family protein
VKTIVVGTDGSESAEIAVNQAFELARAFGAKLVAVSAYKPVSNYRQHEEAGVDMPGDVQYEIGPREDVNLILDAVKNRGAQEGVEVEEIPVEDFPDAALLDTAKQVNADVIVVGSHGMRGPGRFLGSVPNNVSHHADCGVLIVFTG